MSKHTFTAWLQFEVDSARLALLKLIEKTDHLRYIAGPQLEKNYMEVIGHFEETVVNEEMECELLTTKQRMIQAAINRREAIDEAAIDQKIDALRQDMTAAAAGAPPQEYADLDPEQSNELQMLYGKIIKQFHPSVCPNMSEVHKELYNKAQEAYRRKDLEALTLIWDMLTASDEEILESAFQLSLTVGAGEGGNRSTMDHLTDFSLASSLYSNFVAFQEEAAIIEDWERYKTQTSEKMNHLETLKKEFPYNTQELLSDPAQIESYKNELEQRLAQAKREREQLTINIQKMIGESSKHG